MPSHQHAFPLLKVAPVRFYYGLRDRAVRVSVQTARQGIIDRYVLCVSTCLTKKLLFQLRSLKKSSVSFASPSFSSRKKYFECSVPGPAAGIQLTSR